MYPVEYHLPGLSHADMREARRVGGAVANRTGTRCFYNSVSGKLIWVYGTEPAGGPLGVAFRTPDGVRRYGSADIDDMVRYIGYGKMKRSAKDRIIEGQKRAEEHDKEEATEARLAERRRDVESYAAHLSRKRRGTATKVVTV
jgi:hypothetical protein